MKPYGAINYKKVVLCDCSSAIKKVMCTCKNKKRRKASTKSMKLAYKAMKVSARNLWKKIEKL